ncbi:hypothetical protein M3Y99_00449400 [Aphelenchoides fujianensis]|nr:hypothetical protein M3Y99_00449400 [Aphelenchoides fujianensis]
MSWAKRWSEADDWGISGKPSKASKKSTHKRVGKAREASENMLVMAEENADLKAQIEELKWKHAKQQKAATKAAAKEVEQLKAALSDEQTRSSLFKQQVSEQKKTAIEAVDVAGEMKSKLAAVQKEASHRLPFCESLKLEKEEAAAKISELTAALEQQKQAGKSVLAEKVNDWSHPQLPDSQQKSEQPAENSALLDDRAALWAMQQAGFLTDFRLVVDGAEIPVHRPVLALKSAFFESLFRSEHAAAEFVFGK